MVRAGEPRAISLTNFKNMWKEGTEHGSLPRIVIGERLIPDINRPSSGSQMMKSNEIMPTPLGYTGQCR